MDRHGSLWATESSKGAYRNGALPVMQRLAEDLAVQLHAGRKGQPAKLLRLMCSCLLI